MSEQKTGIKLQDLKPSREAITAENSKLGIEAYSKDVKRSLLIGALAIGIELVLYFTKLVK